MLWPCSTSTGDAPTFYVKVFFFVIIESLFEIRFSGTSNLSLTFWVFWELWDLVPSDWEGVEFCSSFGDHLVSKESFYYKLYFLKILEDPLTFLELDSFPSKSSSIKPRGLVNILMCMDPLLLFLPIDIWEPYSLDLSSIGICGSIFFLVLIKSIFL